MSHAPRLELVRLTGERHEMRELQRVLDGARRYAERIQGAPPEPTEARSLYTMLPPGKTDDDKFVYGLMAGSEMVGCADLIRGYPNGETGMLGLLLIEERHQRRGFGAAAYALLEETMRGWSLKRVRIGVVETNGEVLAFWGRLGFTETGERKPWRRGTVESEIVVLEKPLAGAC